VDPADVAKGVKASGHLGEPVRDLSRSGGSVKTGATTREGRLVPWLLRVTGSDDAPARRRLVLSLALAACIVGLALGVWAIDMELHPGSVRRNVNLAGQPVGGLSPEQLGMVVAQLARDYAGSNVKILPPGSTIDVQAPELGLNLRQDQTVAVALNEGRGGVFLVRWWDWAASFVRTDQVQPVVRVDERSVARVLAERDPARRAPVEPSIAVSGDSLVVVKGRPGQGVSPAALVTALAEAATDGLPLTLEVDRSPLAPRFKDEDAEVLATEATAITQKEILISALTRTASVPPATMRQWLRTEPGPDGLRLTVDAESLSKTVSSLLAGVNRAPVDAGFVVRDGRVDIVASQTGVRCCGPQGAAMVEAALRNGEGRTRPLILPVETLQPRRSDERAASLGVKEVVGSFTTSHAAGEPRVRNIHRIADMIRGSVIEPGQTFSVNKTVGPRTAERGFVDAPVIDEKGEFSTSPGGGVSQFATTLFNAAFFAGLDIPGYGMHSLYISRYPYGREATLSFPSLDLQLRNNTSSAVLIWPTYTDTSITVTLYSTKTVEGTQTGQTRTPNGVCTSVATERTRRYLVDGRTTIDRFFARYSPEEGVLCR